MAVVYRPSPDKDPVHECVKAGWRSITQKIGEPGFVPQEEGLTYQEAALRAKQTGESQLLMHIGFVSDVSETLNGEKYFLPSPLPLQLGLRLFLTKIFLKKAFINPAESHRIGVSRDVRRACFP